VYTPVITGRQDREAVATITKLNSSLISSVLKFMNLDLKQALNSRTSFIVAHGRRNALMTVFHETEIGRQHLGEPLFYSTTCL